GTMDFPTSYGNQEETSLAAENKGQCNSHPPESSVTRQMRCATYKQLPASPDPTSPQLHSEETRKPQNLDTAVEKAKEPEMTRKN
ncbi:hypothetical protein P7K49_038927, partial [Saguinus oedipus]